MSLTESKAVWDLHEEKRYSTPGRLVEELENEVKK